MRVRKAVVPVAGLGTRMLPISKAIPKELVPIGPLPALHYVLVEAANAGVEVVVLVNAPWKSALDNYLDVEAALAEKVAGTDKAALLEPILALRERLELVSVRQHGALGLGHAVAAAMPVVGDEPFAVLLPDEVILQPPAGVLTSLVAAAEPGVGAIGVVEVEPEAVVRYGICDLGGAEPPTAIRDLVEKPRPEAAPSRWAIVGRYLFPAGFRAALRELRPGVGGEYQLTDAMRAGLERWPLRAVAVTGRRFDTGNHAGYQEAWRAYLEDPEAFAAAAELR